MADQYDMFLESLTRQATRPVKGTTLGTPRKIKEADQFHGEHPYDPDIDPEGEFWYGKKTPSYQTINPNPPQKPVVGQWSSEDGKFALEKPAKLMTVKKHFNRNDAMRQLRQKMREIQAIKAFLDQEGKDDRLGTEY